jgi:hypothetical protein
MEGQDLPEVQPAMRRAPWDASEPLPWTKIRETWDRYWDHSRPILVEKSPPNLIRTQAIRAHFQPVRFLVMVRNPYAHCEGLMRRNGWDAQRAARFSARCLRQQMENSLELADSLSFTYEELVADPAAMARRIREFLPEIGELDAGRSFAVHSIDGVVERGIVDLNRKKIAALSADSLRQIQEILAANADVLAFWRYPEAPPVA